MRILNNQHTIQAWRVSIAMLISFVYIRLTQVSDGIWIVMTCGIVLLDNSTVGGAINKSFQRAAGTICAGIVSAIVIILFSNSMIANLIAIIIGVCFAAYYFMGTKYFYFGGNLYWTIPIMLLDNHNLNTMFIRPANIIVGIIIVHIVQRIVYPTYAKNLILENFATIINQEVDLLSAVVTNNGVNIAVHDLLENTEHIAISTLNTTYKLIADAKAETTSLPLYTQLCTTTSFHLRKSLKFVATLIHQLSYQDIELTTHRVDLLQQVIKVLESLKQVLEQELMQETDKNDEFIFGIASQLNTLKQEIRTINKTQMVITTAIVRETEEVYLHITKLIELRKNNPSKF